MSSPFKQPWHFDNFRQDQEGEYVKIIGRFQCDFEKDIEVARQMGVQEQGYNQQDYGHAANAKSEGHAEEDAENPYGNPSAKMFAKFVFGKHPGVCPVFEKVVDFLEYNETEKLTKKFNDQFPNHQLMWHIDNLPGNPRRERVINNADFKYQHPDKVRFLIMLEDWEPGQIVQFGTRIYSQWRKGTAFAWEWSTLPHATWNGSWRRRPALQLTGTASSATWNIIKNGNSETVYKV